jgi:hypothetical protein
MALPIDFDTRRVVGKYIDLEGAPMSGTIEFTASVNDIVDVASFTDIVAAGYVATLLEQIDGGTGDFSIVLPVTDDPDETPFFTWTVTFRLTSVNGAAKSNSFSFQLPRSDNPFNLVEAEMSSISPPEIPPPGGSPYVATVDGQSGVVDLEHKYVQTVNGVPPDDGGNVQVSVEGGVTQPLAVCILLEVNGAYPARPAGYGAALWMGVDDPGDLKAAGDTWLHPKTT